MKKRIIALALALAFCGTGFAIDGDNANHSSVSAAQDLSEYENNEILVSYTDGSFSVLSFEDSDQISQALCELEEDSSVASFQPNYTYSSTALSTSDALASQQWALSNDGSFQMVEEQNRYPVYDSPFSSPFAPGRWSMPDYFGMPGGRFGVRNSAYGASYRTSQTSSVSGIDINAEEAWSLYAGGEREVIIALIDTGVDYNHEDLQGVFWTNTSEIANNGIDDDGNGYVDDVNGWNFYNGNNRIYTGSDNSHGTHAAGTIAANNNNGIGISGIVQSGNVKIMVLKALGGSDGSGSTASIIEAIHYAEDNGASICNLSLGSSYNDRALYKAIAESSMLFVAAAGNDSTNTDESPCYPASYDLPNIISVANLNYDGTLHYSTNYGASSVDLAAPGSYILSTTPGNGYSYMTGTSMAAPMVTAAAAMLYSNDSSLSLADVKEIILSSAKQVDSLAGNTVTGGMLDLGAAMSYDTSTLTHTKWRALTVDEGSAPVIDIQTASSNGRTYVTVQISDPDGDFLTAAYARGNLTAEQFGKGQNGQSFSLDSSGTATFSVSSGGEYTFYAIDSMGNEAIKTVSITATEARPMNTRMPTRIVIRWPFR